MLIQQFMAAQPRLRLIYNARPSDIFSKKTDATFADIIFWLTFAPAMPAKDCI